ncbi:WhiB family transcriptional regulator [Rhodococcoides fascians]|uniref:WhiB family transcriptional regulator n=1 Tax=Rhodococcoides fascians TaxID=1828 RepID=UPI00050C5971|nr:WhiB family transcriptional regulator [Rhodococcus fascians]
MPQLNNTLCAGKAPMWDGRIDGESVTDRAQRLDAARRICQRCPARHDCAVEAEASPYTEGIWAARDYLHEEVDVTDPQPLPF